MVWVYGHTKSILVAILMHVPIVVNWLVLIPTSSPEVVFTFDVIFAAALWVLVAAMAVGGWMRDVARVPVTQRATST